MMQARPAFSEIESESRFVHQIRHAASPPSLAALRAAEARAALPALYANRAACALQMASVHDSHLYDCLHDCDDAIDSADADCIGSAQCAGCASGAGSFGVGALILLVGALRRRR